MKTKRCEHCKEHLGARHAHNARFCSGRCRMAAHRAGRRQADPVPSAMTRRQQWVRHTDRKVPLSVAGPKVRPASSTDPDTWSSYSKASRSTAGAGVGFVLSHMDRLVCIDLDHALLDGTLRPWARKIVDALPETYIEVSPSGTGLHIWGFGSVGRGRRIRRGGSSVEVYDRGRYITVTRHPFENAPSRLADLSQVIDDLL
ncbi:DNA primase [Streptomyces europaeiscabiei]|uniref:DNA primase n=1 Tax=Streptomyces europaeiscabiei TaxID=146819 RepID=UPI0029B47F0D|nr:DNA primase [Streptomyces europaeiscabiei]MDX3549495.1 DNA primase [Streptomyces europaeiscabiei]